MKDKNETYLGDSISIYLDDRGVAVLRRERDNRIIDEVSIPSLVMAELLEWCACNGYGRCAQRERVDR